MTARAWLRDRVTRRRIFQIDAGAQVYAWLTDNAVWRDHLERTIGERPPGMRLLDVGCGPGDGTLALARHLGPGSEVVGVDLAAPMIRRAEARLARAPREIAARVSFRCADASALDFDDDRFDLVLGHSFIYLVRGPERIMSELGRVTAPGGELTLVEPRREGRLWQAALAAAPRAPQSLSRDPGSAARFGLSMLSWRAYSGAAGRLTRARLIGLFEAAGFGSVTCVPTLGGLGWLARGTSGAAEG